MKERPFLDHAIHCFNNSLMPQLAQWRSNWVTNSWQALFWAAEAGEI